jgi:hypothetical protein
MSYVTKFEREKRGWMTLAEAVEHVRIVEGYPANDPALQIEVHPIFWLRSRDTLDRALQQIRAALVDGEIPVRWASATLWPDFFFANDDPPQEGTFWFIAAIYPSENYAVLDQETPKVLGDNEWAPDPLGSKRQLLLLRAKVHELWPSPEMVKTKDPIRSFKKILPTLEEIRQVVCEIYDSNSRPNIVEAEKLIKKKLPIAPRKMMRAVLDEPQFLAKRRPAGNSKKSRD